MTEKDLSITPQCPICLEDFKLNEKALLLPCTHHFHYECVKEWFKKQKSCPYCTKKYNYTSIKNIFENRSERLKSITL